MLLLLFGDRPGSQVVVVSWEWWWRRADWLTVTGPWNILEAGREDCSRQWLVDRIQAEVSSVSSFFYTLGVKGVRSGCT